MINKIFFNSWRPYFWIALLGILLYFKALSFNFTYLDDSVAIVDNQHFLSRIENLTEVFRSEEPISFGTQSIYYRPLGAALMILEAQIGGSNPFIYHLTNILLHICASMLVFSVLVSMGYPRPTCAASGFIFTVHPVLVNPVVWIIGRVDILPGIFAFSSFLFLLRFLKNRSYSAYLFNLLFFGLALLCKENVLVLPVLFLIYIWFVAKEKFFSFNQRMFILGWVLVVLGWFFLRQSAIKNPLQLSVLDAIKSLWQSMPAVVLYIGKAIFPFNLSVLPILEDSNFIYGVAVTILTSTALLLSKNKNNRFIFFGLAWFFLLLLPSFVRPQVQFAFFLEHRIYAALLGVFIIILEIDSIKRLRMDRLRGFLVLLLIILVFYGVNFNYSHNYKDRVRFWESAVKSSPHSPLAHRNLGAIYYLDGEYYKAEDEYSAALKLNPYEPMVNNNIGLIYMNKGLYPQAERAFKKELSFNPDYDDVNYNLGLLYARMDRMDEAVPLWVRTIEINPEYGSAYNNLAIHWYLKKDYDKAKLYVYEAQKRGIKIDEKLLKIGDVF